MMNISVIEKNGFNRDREPVSLGIPFPKGTIFGEEDVYLQDSIGAFVDSQTQVLAYWPDKSIKWLLCDFQASVASLEKKAFQILINSQKEQAVLKSGIKVIKAHDSIVVDTGVAEFRLDNNEFKLFSAVGVSEFILTNVKEKVFFPKIGNIDIEVEGVLRTTLKISGCFKSRGNQFFANFSARLSFYAHKNFVKCEFTIHNPRKAGHKGGFWDLGKKGSIFFRDLSLCVKLNDTSPCETEWCAELEKGYSKTIKPLRIYQDSSGGENWKSSNHCNRDGKVMNSFCGYKVYEDGNVILEGKRAEPVVSIVSGNKRISVVLKDFWQNFPKSLETKEGSIVLGLLPKYYSDMYELQGGEQKTHVFYMDFADMPLGASSLGWVNNPLSVYVSPEEYSRTGVFGYLTLMDQDSSQSYKELVNCAIEGEDTFFDKREKIDDFGWRNFGCLYADHEAVREKGEEPLVSHYNNQYDCIQGLLLQFARTGDSRWFSLLTPLANHTVDIDMYHTEKDKSAYNGGLFWHTEHYIDARTSTHRTYSRNSVGDRKKEYCGGGPGNEHNYTTGLMNMYFLSGNLFFREAVIGLADWVISMDDGAKTMFRFIDKGPTGLASQSASEDYHGPGRGSGNSLNALLDGYILTLDKKYMVKAEELIQRCVHPESDIKAQRLDEPEIRWFYLVFLQALGKYLDYKVELGEIDYMYHYARASLLHYAKWMYEHEDLYKFMKAKLQIWTETWPAQDIRKSVVFDYAAKYSVGEERSKFLTKSEYFYNGCIEDLLTFKTKTLLRPMILLMNFGVMHGNFLKNLERSNPPIGHSFDFAKPNVFVHQKERFKRKILCKNK